MAHTETLQRAANEDEVMRAELTRELHHAHDESLAREGVIRRLREELVRVEFHRQQCPPPNEAAVQALIAERNRLQEEPRTRTPTTALILNGLYRR